MERYFVDYFFLFLKKKEAKKTFAKNRDAVFRIVQRIEVFILNRYKNISINRNEKQPAKISRIQWNNKIDGQIYLIGNWQQISETKEIR